jgi:hypothetical protein
MRFEQPKNPKFNFRMVLEEPNITIVKQAFIERIDRLELMGRSVLISENFDRKIVNWPTDRKILPIHFCHVSSVTNPLIALADNTESAAAELVAEIMDVAPASDIVEQMKAVDRRRAMGVSALLLTMQINEAADQYIDAAIEPIDFAAAFSEFLEAED